MLLMRQKDELFFFSKVSHINLQSTDINDINSYLEHVFIDNQNNSFDNLAETNKRCKSILVSTSYYSES